MIKKIFNNFYRYSFLLRQLISRDFKVKYKRSVLGIVWSLLYPLLMLTVMTVIFSSFMKFKVEGTNYIVYLMIGIVCFNFLSEATNLSLGTIIDNYSLINKVYIPKYIFPLSKILFVFINFLLTLIPLFLIILLSKVGLGVYPAYIGIKYIYLIYIFFCLLIFIIGLGLIFSSISVFFRDVIYIYGIFLTIWNYFTPIFYNVEMLPPLLQKVMNFNPMYQILKATRQIVLYGQTPSLMTFCAITIFALIFFSLGVLIFRKNQDKFIYYI